MTAREQYAEVLAHVAGIPLPDHHDYITTSMPKRIIEAAREALATHQGITSVDDLAEHLGYGELPLAALPDPEQAVPRHRTDAVSCDLRDTDAPTSEAAFCPVCIDKRQAVREALDPVRRAVESELGSQRALLSPDYTDGLIAGSRIIRGVRA